MCVYVCIICVCVMCYVCETDVLRIKTKVEDLEEYM